MSRKPDRAALARVDARTITREAEWGREDFDYYQSWEAQLGYYRDLADNLPDQNRSAPIWTPVSEIGKRGREYLEAEGAPQKEIGGILHYQTGSRETPRAILDHQINDAEAAARAGDLGRYGLHIQAIVTTLHRLQLPSIAESVISANQSKRSRGKSRRSRWGTLRKILEAMRARNAAEVIERWKKGTQIAGFALVFDPGSNKPFRANEEGFSAAQIRQKVSAMRASKKRNTLPG